MSSHPAIALNPLFSSVSLNRVASSMYGVNMYEDDDFAVVVGPWRQFMESYTKMNPNLVDRESTAHSLPLTSLLPTHSGSSLGKHKREPMADQVSSKKLK